MELFIVRHAIAEKRSPGPQSAEKEFHRPLTAHGKKKFKASSSALKKLIGPVDFILTSPLIRAKQTAKILAKHYPQVPLGHSFALAPTSKPSEFIKWCKANPKLKKKRLVIVGHEPHLSLLASWLLCGSSQSILELKKGGCLSLSIPKSLGPNSALLHWSITPKSLSLDV